jgi:hypothetical protein
VNHRSLQMWDYHPLNQSLVGTKAGTDYLGTSGATFRIRRAITLRTLPNNQYDKVRRDLKHHDLTFPQFRGHLVKQVPWTRKSSGAKN